MRNVARLDGGGDPPSSISSTSSTSASVRGGPSPNQLRNIFNIALINARSIVPKLDSLYECQNELENDVTILTETWIKDSENINKLLQDYEDRTGYAIICKDRTSTRGGGVAISFNKSRIQMSRAPLTQLNFEVVAAIGRRTGQRRKVCVVAVYLRLWYPAERTRRCLVYVNDCITILSSPDVDPYFYVGGDFNKKDVRRATAHFPLIRTVTTPPTRGNNILDDIATNNLPQLVDSGVTHPIANQHNIESDHKVVFASFRMPRVQPYSVNSYTKVCWTLDSG